MEGKRHFRSTSTPPVRYPTHAELEPSRRSFLLRLGLGALATCLGLTHGCTDEPKMLGGLADHMPAPMDAGIERALSGKPDAMVWRDGELQPDLGQPDARQPKADRRQRRPDRRP